MFNFTFVDYDGYKSYLYGVKFEDAMKLSEWFYNQSFSITVGGNNDGKIGVLKEYSMKSISVERVG